MAYKKVEFGTWKPEKEGDSIEGIFLRTSTDVGENHSNIYNLEVDGKPIGIWGSAVLDKLMLAARPDTKIKIVYLGKGKAQKGHSAPKLFDLFIDE